MKIYAKSGLDVCCSGPGSFFFQTSSWTTNLQAEHLPDTLVKVTGMQMHGGIHTLQTHSVRCCR